MQKLFAALALLLSPLFLLSQKEIKPTDYNVAVVGFYNLENLFDTLDDPYKNDAEFLPGGDYVWTPAKYASKEANMAKVISQLGTEKNPDGVAILGVAEVENRKVLEDLVAQPALKDRHYQIAHFESPDERGIDCGLLYNPKYFKIAGARPVRVDLSGPSDSVKDYTRDVLCVTGLLDGERVTVMVNHWPSRRGGPKASEPARAKAAAVCRHVVDSLSAADPAAKIIIMGDLNDDPTDKSLTKVLKAKGSRDDLQPGELYNPMYSIFNKGNGSLAYNDAWNLFDQIILSQPLVNKESGGWQLYKTTIFRQPWLLETEGKYRGYPKRTFSGTDFINGYSDHLPVYVFLVKKKAAK